MIKSPRFGSVSSPEVTTQESVKTRLDKRGPMCNEHTYGGWGGVGWGFYKYNSDVFLILKCESFY